MEWIDRISALFDEFGGQAYLEEPVTLAEHTLQTAWLAEQADAPVAMVTAALLHDIGHLLHLQQHGRGSPELDTMHEYRGSTWLRPAFGPEVFEPVRLHVEAKRYLCVAQPGYLETLSPSAVKSLARQGGPFSADEVREFKGRPFAEDAISLRRWDDLARRQGESVPGFGHFRKCLEIARHRRRTGE